MSTSKEQNRKGRQANQVIVEIIRVDGRHETATVDRVKWLKEIEQLIGANCLDSVDLRDGRMMLVDDQGYSRGLPDNAEATALYHEVCKPGTTQRIKGNVVIGRDEDFA
jgi:hypothetical protein